MTAALRLEAHLLVRHGVVAAAAVLTVAWSLVLGLLPEAARPIALELVVYSQLAVIGYTFAGALVLLSKGEGTMLALVVTPLRLTEQVAARVGALTALALLVTGVVLAVAGPLQTPTVAVALSVAATSAIALLVSVAVAARYDEVSAWVLPSVPPLLLLAAPLVAYLGVESPALWLLPTNGALVLLRGPSGWPQAVLAVLVSAAWTAAAGWLAVHRMTRWAATADA